jgi:hypothetical protein
MNSNIYVLIGNMLYTVDTLDRSFGIARYQAVTTIVIVSRQVQFYSFCR